MKIALAQINPTVGDLEGNASKIIKFIDRAKNAGADIVCFPELAITGYPPEDLLLKPQFITDNLLYLKEIIKETKGIAVVIGFVDKVKDLPAGRHGKIFNAAAFITN
ncbi:MAG: nitrilase-related carbon-nitrogen hydrolase, partial [bacterium]